MAGAANDVDVIPNPVPQSAGNYFDRFDPQPVAAPAPSPQGSNPFDKFDRLPPAPATGPNPFDQFDEPKTQNYFVQLEKARAAGGNIYDRIPVTPTGSSAPASGNIYDQLDAGPAPAPTTPRAAALVPPGENIYDHLDQLQAQAAKAQASDPQYEQLLKDNPEAAGWYMMGKQAVAAVPTVINAGLTTAGAVGGAALGSLAAPGPGTVAGGAAGGVAGNLAGQYINRALGYQGDISAGQAVGAGFMGAVPGGSLAEAGLGQVLRAGTKAAATNLTATAAQTLIDNGELPSGPQALISAAAGYAGTAFSKALDSGSSATAMAAKTAAAQNATRDATLAEARGAGYVIPPFETNPSASNNALGSVAGKAAVKQAAAKANQDTTNELAARAIGLDPKQPITLSAINQVRQQANQAYAAVGALSPQASADLYSLREARNEIGVYAKDYSRNATPSSLEKVKLLRQQADQLEGSLENHAVAAAQTAFNNSNGSPQALQQAAQLYDLVPAMRQARVLLAQTHVVENALNEANGEISAPVIGALYAKGSPLSGSLATIGRFQQAFPHYAGEASKTPAAAVSALNPILATAAAVGGHAAHGIPGAIIGGLAPSVARSSARAFQLSAPVQAGFLSLLSRPSYSRAYADIPAQLARMAAMSSAQPQAIPPYLLPNTGRP